MTNKERIMEKEVKFEVGNWYKIRENEFIKFSRIENYIDYNKIYYSEIINKTFIKKNDYIASKSLEKYALNNPVSIEEIQQYLPEGHPDKIKSNDFKVGDWVIAIGNIDKYENPTIGKLNEFSTKRNYDSRVSFYGTGRYLSIWAYVIRHATPEEINQHLISIGQIPADEPLNTDSLKMILSIDDEELPMVSIIKTNTVKQLLNND